MNEDKLTPGEFMKLYNIFKTNKWHLKEEHSHALENLAHMLPGLTENQKALMFDLCNRFLWISMSEYQGHLKNLLDKVDAVRLRNINRIILFPIVKPEDDGRIKSAGPLIYATQVQHMWGPQYEKVTRKVIDSYDDILAERFRDTDLLFLIDDFIGSGETINEVLDKLQNNVSLNPNQINILTLVIQNNSATDLQNMGHKLYYLFLLFKGISDHYVDPELSEKISVMEELEKLIPGDKFFNFGYERSEALVTLIRTPDNTFPIFWRSHKQKGKFFRAPFPRD